MHDMLLYDLHNLHFTMHDVHLQSRSPLPWLIPCHRTSVWTWMALLPFAPHMTTWLDMTTWRKMTKKKTQITHLSTRHVNYCPNDIEWHRMTVTPHCNWSACPLSSSSTSRQDVSDDANSWWLRHEPAGHFIILWQNQRKIGRHLLDAMQIWWNIPHAWYCELNMIHCTWSMKYQT